MLNLLQAVSAGTRCPLRNAERLLGSAYQKLAALGDGTQRTKTAGSAPVVGGEPGGRSARRHTQAVGGGGAGTGAGGGGAGGQGGGGEADRVGAALLAEHLAAAAARRSLRLWASESQCRPAAAWSEAGRGLDC